MSREHAADHLLVECAAWNGRTGLLLAAGPGFDPAAHFTAQVDELVAIGLVDADEGARWRARFAEQARADPPLEVDDELRWRVARHLESLIDTAREDQAFKSALHVFERIGALSQPEMMEWFERLYAGESEPEPESDDEWPEVAGPDLLGVVLGPPETAGGVRVVCVELYPAGVIVKWTGRDMEHISLSDDSGTTYEEADWEVDDCEGSLLRGEASFTPAVPAAATRLLATVAGFRVEIGLGR